MDVQLTTVSASFAVLKNEIVPEKPLTGKTLWRISAENCHNQSWTKALCAYVCMCAHMCVCVIEKEKEIVDMQ